MQYFLSKDIGMMRKSLLLLIFLASCFYSSAYAVIIEESCTAGIYAVNYTSAASCNTCGYEAHHYYINTSFDTWDWLQNVDGAEKIISGLSS